MCADPRQAERDALAELTIEAPNNNIETQVKPPEPEVAPDSDADPQPGPQPESNLVPEAEPVRDLGGREPEHAWGDAADYVEGIIKKEKRPLPRKKDGSPNIARGVALMMEYFKDEPEPPKERSVRRWIKRQDNWPRTSKWWDDNIVAHLLRQ